jgi:hypothetical protein
MAKHPPYPLRSRTYRSTCCCHAHRSTWLLALLLLPLADYPAGRLLICCPALLPPSRCVPGTMPSPSPRDRGRPQRRAISSPCLALPRSSSHYCARYPSVLRPVPGPRGFWCRVCRLVARRGCRAAKCRCRCGRAVGMPCHTALLARTRPYHATCVAGTELVLADAATPSSSCCYDRIVAAVAHVAVLGSRCCSVAGCCCLCLRGHPWTRVWCVLPCLISQLVTAHRCASARGMAAVPLPPPASNQIEPSPPATSTTHSLCAPSCGCRLH